MEDISLWIVIFALLLLLRKKIQPESKHVVIYGWSISAVIVAIFYLMSLNKTGTQKGFSNALWISFAGLWIFGVIISIILYFSKKSRKK
jgi:heme/copper-type cytochrome/quinol oxidase subunit 4